MPLDNFLPHGSEMAYDLSEPVDDCICDHYIISKIIH